MLALLGLLAVPPLQAQKACGDITLTSQEDINRFDCRTINGDLTIDGFFDPITDLTPLESLTSVTGTVGIAFTSRLTSLSGLHNLTSVGGDFHILGNATLSSLAGLENLTSVGALRIMDNDALWGLAGLENLTSIKGRLFITDNDALVLLKLENLTFVGGGLAIVRNGVLGRCSCALSGLISGGSFTGVVGAVEIHSNHKFGECGSTVKVLDNASKCENASESEANLNLATRSTAGRFVGDSITHHLDLYNFGPTPASDIAVQVVIPTSLPVIEYGTGCYLERIEQQRQFVRCSGGTLSISAWCPRCGFCISN